MKRLRRPRYLIAALATIAVLAALLTWAFWPDKPAPPRARQYLDYTACLITDQTGITGPAAPVWAGMQDVSLARHIKVTYLATPLPQTAENITPYLNGLLQRKCNIVVAIGPAPISAALIAAARNPQTAFLLIGNNQSRDNVTAIQQSPADTLHTDVRTALDRIAAQSTG